MEEEEEKKFACDLTSVGQIVPVKSDCVSVELGMREVGVGEGSYV